MATVVDRAGRRVSSVLRGEWAASSGADRATRRSRPCSRVSTFILLLSPYMKVLPLLQSFHLLVGPAASTFNAFPSCLQPDSGLFRWWQFLCLLQIFIPREAGCGSCRHCTTSNPFLIPGHFLGCGWPLCRRAALRWGPRTFGSGVARVAVSKRKTKCGLLIHSEALRPC